jgi:hypothetical protein
MAVTAFCMALMCAIAREMKTSRVYRVSDWYGWVSPTFSFKAPKVM